MGWSERERGKGGRKGKREELRKGENLYYYIAIPILILLIIITIVHRFRAY